MRRATLATSALALLLALASPRASHATQVTAVTVEELSRRADLVVLATPTGSRSFWDHGAIATAWQLRVTLLVRGAASSATLTLELPGGEVGSLAQRVPGVPALVVGRPYLLFLSAAGERSGVYYLAHLTAAALSMSESAGQVLVRPPLEGLAPGGRMDPRSPVALGPLLEAVRSAR